MIEVWGFMWNETLALCEENPYDNGAFSQKAVMPKFEIMLLAWIIYHGWF